MRLRPALLPLLAAGLALAGPATASPAPRLVYTVARPAAASDRLAISLEIRGWPEPALHLHGVPAYMDNPLAVAEGQVVRDLAARDAAGHPLAVLPARPGARGEPRWLVETPDGSATITYTASPRFAHGEQTDAYPIQLPFLAAERGWLYGNYVLCFPEPDSLAQRLVSAPLDIRALLLPPAGERLFGPPADTLRFANLYELLSLQWGYGRHTVLDLGRAGGVPLSLVLRDTLEFSLREREVLRRRLRKLVDESIAFFGAPPFPSAAFYCFRGEADGTGGLEGSFVCQVHAARGVDLADTAAEKTAAFFEVALHEFFHTYTPIVLFAREDPWFKEGVTSYYGYALAARLGWVASDYWRGAFAAPAERAERNPLLGRVPLTDPGLWHREYLSEEWRALTYDRGLVVALLLDDWIRQRTPSSQGLDDVLRLLFRRHAHAGFSHADLLTAVAQTAGEHPGPFFADYVEGTVLPQAQEVEAALGRAEAAGAFGSARGIP